MRFSRILLVVTATGILAVASSCRDIVAPPPVATISLSDNSVELVLQETEQLVPTLSDAAGNPLTRPVTWSTSAPEVATVDNGLVTARGIGAAVVTAASEGIRAEVPVSVGDGGIISPSGSIITGLGGQVALEVPSAAVTQSARIIIALPSVVLASTRLIPGSAVSLRTQAPLTQSALLTIRYNPNRILGSPESGLRLYKATLTDWQPVAGSTVNVNSNFVRGRISSGGIYGIFAQASVGSVSVSPVSAGLKAGESKLFASLVKDADGNQLDGRAEVWSSSAPAVIQIDAASGRATANSPGSAVITATVEEKSGSTTVLVTPGVAARIEIVRGDRQNADTSAAVAIAPAVKVTDQAGFAVAGAIVQFAVVTGNGVISPASATTDTLGMATVERWVLGRSAGPNTATATIAGGASVTFSSTSTLPPPPQPPVVTPPPPPAPIPAPKLTPTTIAIFAGDGQSAPPFAAVPIRPAVRVTDANGAPVRDVVVTFSIRSGGGSITRETATTDSGGVAVVGSWTLGSGGGNSLFATQTGLSGSPLIFIATATTTVPPSPSPPQSAPPPSTTGPPAGPPVFMAIYAGDGQSAGAQSPVPVSPAVRVTDATGIAVPGVIVTFSIRSGSGTISGEVATTNSLGIATLGQWTLGGVGGNSLFATRVGLSGSPLIFTATATAGVRRVTFGDSNTDAGWAGSTPPPVATSYVSVEGPYAGPNTNNPTQLAGKIETKWRAASAVSVAAVNHGISGTGTGAGRTGSGAPNAREFVGGTTRFAGEVLGSSYPWSGGESGQYYPNGAVRRVAAFVPGPNDFAYVSMGTNDPILGFTAPQSGANLNWMIDQWVGAGRQIDHFILTTLPPRPATNGAIVLINQQIRQIASARGIYLVDLAGRTSDDNGGTWRSSADHVGDYVHYSESVRDWIATQVVAYMLTKAPR